MFPTYISILDIQSWWEVPSIAHFCSLFRRAFNLLDFDIEDLEEALLADGTEDSSWLQLLIVRLLSGCLPHNEISTFNYQMFLRRLFRQKCQEYEQDNPFNSDVDFQLLPLRTKVHILQALCDFRLDADDVFESLKNLEADCLRVEPLGYDSKKSAYWYFYGTRLYREDFAKYDRQRTKSVWQVVCFSQDDWLHLARKLEHSQFREDRQLLAALSDNFLPELPRLFRDKERLTRKRLLDSLPKRRSARIKDSEALPGDDEEEFGEESSSSTIAIAHDLVSKERADEQRQRREEAYLRRSRNRDASADSNATSRSSSSCTTVTTRSAAATPPLVTGDPPPVHHCTATAERYDMAGTKSRDKKSSSAASKSTTRQLRKAVSEDSDDGSEKDYENSVKHRGSGRTRSSTGAASAVRKQSPQRGVSAEGNNSGVTTSVGRQTNNSLASATGQILIQPVSNPLRKKLKTSLVFSQSEEDLQVGMHKILDYVKDHEDAWPFVDPVEEDYAPNYYSIIRRPMDLQRMEERLDAGSYATFSKFKADFQLIVNNCRLYNGVDNEYTKMVDNLEGVFEKATERYLDQITSSDDEIAVEYSDGGDRKRKHHNDSHRHSPTKRKASATAEAEKKKNNVSSDMSDLMDEEQAAQLVKEIREKKKKKSQLLKASVDYEDDKVSKPVSESKKLSPKGKHSKDKEDKGKLKDKDKEKEDKYRERETKSKDKEEKGKEKYSNKHKDKKDTEKLNVKKDVDKVKDRKEQSKAKDVKDSSKNKVTKLDKVKERVKDIESKKEQKHRDKHSDKVKKKDEKSKSKKDAKFKEKDKKDFDKSKPRKESVSNKMKNPSPEPVSPKTKKSKNVAPSGENFSVDGMRRENRKPGRKPKKKKPLTQTRNNLSDMCGSTSPHRDTPLVQTSAESASVPFSPKNKESAESKDTKKPKQLQKPSAKYSNKDLFDYDAAVFHLKDSPESRQHKDKHNKLLETIEMLKAKSEKKPSYFFDRIEPTKENIEECPKKKRKTKKPMTLDAIDKKEKSENNSGDEKKDFSSIKSNDTIDALALATEQTLKDINKWLVDTPRFTEFSSNSNSPSHFAATMEDFDRQQPVVAPPPPPPPDPPKKSSKIVEKPEKTPAPIVAPPPLPKKEPPPPPPPPKEPKKRAAKASEKDNAKDGAPLAKQARKREVQRTIDRLQPGKSKGNLITNVPATNKSTDDTIFPIVMKKDTKNSLIVKTDDSAPKLSLGSVLDSFGKHQFIDDEPEKSEPAGVGNNEKSTKSVDNPTADSKKLDSDSSKNELASRSKNVDKKELSVEEHRAPSPLPVKEHSPGEATPNLIAWFKAFGAPKVQKKPEDEELPVSKAAVSSDKAAVDELMSAGKVNSGNIGNPARVTVPLPDPSPNPDSPVTPYSTGKVAAPRARKISTGSSMSERSSFSQDMDSPRVGMDERGSYPAPYPSPMHQSSGASPNVQSPRADMSPKTAAFGAAAFNGQMRVGFYQDTVGSSTKSSPDKSCSPREMPQSPYAGASPYPGNGGNGNGGEHVYTPPTNTTTGGSASTAGGAHGMQNSGGYSYSGHSPYYCGPASTNYSTAMTPTPPYTGPEDAHQQQQPIHYQHNSPGAYYDPAKGVSGSSVQSRYVATPSPATNTQMSSPRTPQTPNDGYSQDSNTHRSADENTNVSGGGYDYGRDTDMVIEQPTDTTCTSVPKSANSVSAMYQSNLSRGSSSGGGSSAAPSTAADMEIETFATQQQTQPQAAHQQHQEQQQVLSPYSQAQIGMENSNSNSSVKSIEKHSDPEQSQHQRQLNQQMQQQQLPMNNVLPQAEQLDYRQTLDLHSKSPAPNVNPFQLDVTHQKPDEYSAGRSGSSDVYGRQQHVQQVTEEKLQQSQLQQHAHQQQHLSAMFPVKKRAYNEQSPSDYSMATSTALQHGVIHPSAPANMNMEALNRQQHEMLQLEQHQQEQSVASSRPIRDRTTPHKYVSQNIPDPRALQQQQPQTVVQPAPISQQQQQQHQIHQHQASMIHQQIHHHHQQQPQQQLPAPVVSSSDPPANLTRDFNNYGPAATSATNLSTTPSPYNYSNYPLNVPATRQAPATATPVTAPTTYDHPTATATANKIDMSKYTNMGYSSSDMTAFTRNSQPYNYGKPAAGSISESPMPFNAASMINLGYKSMAASSSSSGASPVLQGPVVAQAQPAAYNRQEPPSDRTTAYGNLGALVDNSRYPGNPTASAGGYYGDKGLPANLAAAAQLFGGGKGVGGCGVGQGAPVNAMPMFTTTQTTMAMAAAVYSRNMHAAAVAAAAQSSSSSQDHSHLVAAKQQQPPLTPALPPVQPAPKKERKTKPRGKKAAAAAAAAAVAAAATAAMTPAPPVEHAVPQAPQSLSAQTGVNALSSQGFQSYAGLKNAVGVSNLEPNAISLKTAPGSAFNFGPTTAGLGLPTGLYGDKDSFNFLEDFRSSAPNFYMAAAAAAHRSTSRTTPDAGSAVAISGGDKQNLATAVSSALRTGGGTHNSASSTPSSASGGQQQMSGANPVSSSSSASSSAAAAAAVAGAVAVAGGYPSFLGAVPSGTVGRPPAYPSPYHQSAAAAAAGHHHLVDSNAAAAYQQYLQQASALSHAAAAHNHPHHAAAAAAAAAAAHHHPSLLGPAGYTTAAPSGAGAPPPPHPGYHPGLMRQQYDSMSRPSWM